MEQVLRTTIDKLTDHVLLNLPQNITRDSIRQMLATYAALYANSETPLSAVKFDYEAVRYELESILARSDAWRDTITTGTGQSLINIVATGTSYNEYSVERAVHEAFCETARLPNSIYTATRHLGVRIRRRIPAHCRVSLVRSDDLSNSLLVPAYSNFNLSSYPYFNRDDINFPANVAVLEVTVYEGEVYTAQVRSDGTPYQRYTFGASDFTISDRDVAVYVDGVQWRNTQYEPNYSLGLWEYGPDDAVFEESTTTDGNSAVKFGNGITGRMPPLNALIEYYYARTNGSAGNTNLIGRPVTTSAYSKLSGVVLSASIDGQNERDPQDYVTLSPGLFAAQHRAGDEVALASAAKNYPGVIDATLRNQAQIAPHDLRYMMAFEFTLLLQSEWGDAELKKFRETMVKQGIANSQIILRMAESVPTTISVAVLGNKSEYFDVLVNNIRANIAALCTPRFGSLGRTLYLTDISDAIKNTDRTVIEAVQLLEPMHDVILQPWQYVKLVNSSVNMKVVGKR